MNVLCSCRDWRFKGLITPAMVYQTNFVKTSFQDISSDWMIPDTHDNEAPAIVVYSAVFKFYQKHLQKTLVNHTGHDETHPVRWVIVVPATWNDSAREFLLAAAQEVYLLLRCMGTHSGETTVASCCQVSSLHNSGWLRE